MLCCFLKALQTFLNVSHYPHLLGILFSSRKSSLQYLKPPPSKNFFQINFTWQNPHFHFWDYLLALYQSDFATFQFVHSYASIRTGLCSRNTKMSSLNRILSNFWYMTNKLEVSSQSKVQIVIREPKLFCLIIQLGFLFPKSSHDSMWILGYQPLQLSIFTMTV